MQPVLEDLFIGPSASPSFDHGFRWEDSSRLVRVVFGGVTIADTRHPRLLLETGLPTRYYIPEQDVRMELLEPTETTTRCPYKGKASYWSAKVGDRVFKDIVWSYHEILPT